MSKCVVVPNFLAVSQAVAEIWRFFDFKGDGRPHLGFSKGRNFRFWKGEKGQNAPSCQISRRSVKPLLRYGDFSIYQDGSSSHLIPTEQIKQKIN